MPAAAPPSSSSVLNVTGGTLPIYPPTIFYQPTLKDFHWIKSNSNNQLESSEPEDIAVDWQGNFTRWRL